MATTINSNSRRGKVPDPDLTDAEFYAREYADSVKDYNDEESWEELFRVETVQLIHSTLMVYGTM